MPFGFQPIIDLSALSIKLLNDQLNLLWKKVMGGISTRDLGTDLKKVIDSKASAKTLDDMGNAVAAIDTRLTQTAQAVTLAASREELDEARERVRYMESELDVQAGQIQGMVTKDDLGSLIRQRADEVRLAVGLIGGENLVRNSAAVFGLTAWQNAGAVGFERRTDAELGRSVFFIEAAQELGGGGMRQTDLQLRAGSGYILSCLCDGAGLSCALRDAQGTVLGSAALSPGSGMRELRFAFRAALGLRNPCTLSFFLPAGTARITDIQIEEGETPTAWKPNPNELSASGIQITEDRVRIDAKHFELALHDDSGEVTTQMSAGAMGFNRLVVSENLYIGGLPLFLPAGAYHLWVYPYAPATGGKYATAVQPTDANLCYPTLQKAIDAVPRWLNGDVTIHVWGADTYQYPESRIVVQSFFGGGTLTFKPWVDYAPYILRRLDIVNNALSIQVERARVYSGGEGDIFHVANATVTFIQCVVNGRLLTGYAEGGFSSFYNACVILRSCQAHNCRRGVRASAGGRVFIDACAGSGNDVGTLAESGGIVNQNSHTFPGNQINVETTGGRILTATVTVGDVAAPPAVQVQFMRAWVCVATRSYGSAWRADNDHLYQGVFEGSPNHVGLIWLDNANLRQTLAGKEILSARIQLRRRSAGGSADGAPLYLGGYGNASASGTPNRVRAYGRMGDALWGQVFSAQIPAGAIEDIRSGAIQALGVYAGNADEYAIWEGKSGNAPLVEVCYR